MRIGGVAFSLVSFASICRCRAIRVCFTDKRYFWEESSRMCDNFRQKHSYSVVHVTTSQMIDPRFKTPTTRLGNDPSKHCDNRIVRENATDLIEYIGMIIAVRIVIEAFLGRRPCHH